MSISSASPLPLSAVVVDAEENGDHQLIVSDGREAHLYVISGCRIQTVVDQAGAPFAFDLGHRQGNGDGVGCSDLGDGRHLVGLLVQQQGGQWTVRRTEIDLDGTTATIGRSDTVTANSAQDPRSRRPTPSAAARSPSTRGGSHNRGVSAALPSTRRPHSHAHAILELSQLRVRAPDCRCHGPRGLEAA